MTNPMDRDPRYYRGVQHFNKREFFDAHEIWEELWKTQQGEAKNFLQGLIQFATALHHFERGNLKGTRMLFESGTKLFSSHPKMMWGLSLDNLQRDMKACLSDVLSYNLEDLPGRMDPTKDTFPVKLKAELLPKILLEER